jgi:excisionase family DNA binding protein
LTHLTTETRVPASRGNFGLTLAEAAERSGYGVSTLRRHIKDGGLRAVKAKGRVYIRPDDLDEFAEPVAMNSTEESLQEWAKRVAAKAPPFSAEQRAIILSAFATTLRD